MALTPIPVDLGFAEFVSTLLSETIDSIIASQMSQEERLRALLESVNLPREDFAAIAIGDDDVERALVRLFGDGEGGHQLAVGVKVPAELLEVIGVELDGAGGIDAAGVAAVREGVRLLLAVQQQDALRATARQGVPRVIVDAGKLRAKLTFSAVHIGDEGEGDSAAAAGPSGAAAGPAAGPIGGGAAGGAAATTNLRDIALGAGRPVFASRIDLGNIAIPGIASTSLHRANLVRAIPEAIRDVRLQVRPASAADPQGDTSRTDVYGEVEISFRTVT